MARYSEIILILFLLIIVQLALAKTNNLYRQLYSKTPAKVQESAVQKLITRVVGSENQHRFLGEIDVTMDSKSFQIKKVEQNVIIRGSDGVSVSKGFHHYLKYYLNRDISWLNTKVTHIPNVLPDVNVTSKSNSQFIYYQNVCAWSYSYAWWSWNDWRRHIDWMSMMGVSLTIAPIQEQIWYNIYKKVGLTDAEILDHFSGPAFLAWHRMGNIYGWGGPISESYRKSQFILQKRIIRAQRNLGMLVAIPGFAGHVPLAFERIYPNETLTKMERWNRFPDKYCCVLFIEPNTELFLQIGSMFLREAIASYGSDHIFFCDPFNEINPRLADRNYLSNTSLHIHKAMTLVDSSAIWLLQGWMFVENNFWTMELIEAFLTSIPLGKMIILDLQSEQFPQYKKTRSYFGQPFIWCMLHNFGGTLGMHGSTNVINTEIRIAQNMENSTIVGVGITPEGIYQNYVMYSLVLERAWVKSDFNMTEWFLTFSSARYGTRDENINKAWMQLQASVYSFHGTVKLRGKYIVTQRPSTNLSPWLWYNASSIMQAYHFFLNPNKTQLLSHQLYENDLVDITRQFLQTLLDKLYPSLMSAYRKHQKDKFIFIFKVFLEIFDDLDDILKTNTNFLLGKWIKSARKFGKDSTEKYLYEINARNQITAWGPNTNIPDYATKQWSGIVKYYYLPRWKLFIDSLMDSLMKKSKFSESKFQAKVINLIENPFSFRQSNFSDKPTGDSFQISSFIFKKWYGFIKHRSVSPFFV